MANTNAKMPRFCRSVNEPYRSNWDSFILTSVHPVCKAFQKETSKQPVSTLKDLSSYTF